MDSHDAARRDHIVAAHAAGQSVTAIQQSFGLPRAEVEHILAEAVDRPSGPAPSGYPPPDPFASDYGRPEVWGAPADTGLGPHSARLPSAGHAGYPAGAGRPPWPVMVAVALLGSYAVLSVLLRLGAGGFGAYQAGGLVGSVLTGLVAYLLWKGRRGAWILTLVLGVLGILGRLLVGDVLGAVVAAAVVLLLVTPESARAWFRS